MKDKEKAMGDSAMEVDEALSMLGKYGRWQILFFIILSLGMNFPGCWHTLGYVFQAHTPHHHCMVEDGSMINDTIPWDKDLDSYSRCLIFKNSSGPASFSYKHENSELGLLSNTTTFGSDIEIGGNANDTGVAGSILRRARPRETVACSKSVKKWNYYGEGSQSSIVAEWDLVCEYAYMKKTSHLVAAFGIMVGTAFFTPLIDYFGRKPVFLGLSWIMIVVGLWNAFVQNYYVYLVVRFLTGALRPGYGLAAFILACELFPANQRTFAGIIIEDFWGIGMCILALFMYLIPNWRHLQILISLCGLLTIPLYWFLPESIPWLITKGRVKTAEKTIQRAARMNGIRDFPKNVFLPSREESEPLNGIKVQNGIKDQNGITANTDHNLNNGLKNGLIEEFELKDENRKNGLIDRLEIKDGKHSQNGVGKGNKNGKKGRCGVLGQMFRRKSTSDTRYTVLDVLRHPRLRFFTLIMSILWFVNSTVYYGMTLHTGDLDGNRYLNLFYSGLVEIPAYTLSYFIINRWGRRLPLVAFHVVAGIFLILSQVIPKEMEDGTSLEQVRIAFTMIGKCGITASYGVVYIFAPELFPTTIRSQAMGIAAICGRIGNMLAPFSSSLNDVKPWMTSVVFGVVSVVGGLMVLMLPETNRRPLPQTIDEIEAWFKPQPSQISSIDLSLHTDDIKNKEKT